MLVNNATILARQALDEFATHVVLKIGGLSADRSLTQEREVDLRVRADIGKLCDQYRALLGNARPPAGDSGPADTVLLWLDQHLLLPVWGMVASHEAAFFYGIQEGKSPPSTRSAALAIAPMHTATPQEPGTERGVVPPPQYATGVMRAAANAQPQAGELQATASLAAGLAELTKKCHAAAQAVGILRGKEALAAKNRAADRADRAAYIRGPPGPQRQQGQPRTYGMPQAAQPSGVALGAAPNGATAYQHCADFQRGGPAACTRGGRCRHFHGHPPK
jgi:hypothetical protein